ncbi:MAG: hypothetical protein IJV86_01715 [Clostridia bacterium]|nr:hypothetical protein [Clostridia bacterium]
MKNILILTVDCWNLNIGANTSYTYSNLFSTMEEYNISNIYIREELPNDPCCKRYFQIRESQIIKGLLKRTTKTGREVECGALETEKDTEGIARQRDFYNKQRGRFYYTKKLIREAIWLLSPWKSKELDLFLKEVKPDIIIFSMEGYIHFNRICRYALKKTKAKGIGYFWDDNFTYKQRPGNIGYMVLRFFQRNSLKKLSKKTNAFWAIAPKTKKEADEFFEIDCILLPKPMEREVSKQESREIEEPVKMFYAGNLMIGRLDSVKLIAEIFEEINKDKIRMSLDVYTSTLIPEELKKQGKGIEFHEPVSQSEVLRLQQNADVLLFAEAITGKERKAARLSFSTKIPDYLSCGKCIIAVGDKDIAPMEYFESEGVALCAENEEELRENLRRILTEPHIMKEYGEKARLCALKNHSKDKIQEIVRNTINEVQ